MAEKKKKLSDRDTVELKAMAFETTHQINLLKKEQARIVMELVKRKAIAETAEINPNE